MIPKDYLFVVGVGRSGTTLLQSMIASHSRIAMMPETGFIRLYLATGKLGAVRKRSGRNQLEQTIADDRYFDRLKPAMVLKAVNAAMQAVDRVDYIFYKTLLDAHALEAGASFAADKDPRAIEYLPIIRRYFPKAHVINIIRDPRAVLSSKKKAQWSMNRHPIVHIFANRVQLRLGRRLGRRLFAGRYHEIYFEHLLEEPADVLKRLGRQTGLGYERAMVNDYRRSAEQLVHDTEINWKKETLGPIRISNIGKWKRSLANWEIALTELVCSEAFRLGSYPKSNALKSLPRIQALVIIATAVAIRAICPVYEVFRIWKLRRSVQ